MVFSIFPPVRYFLFVFFVCHTYISLAAFRMTPSLEEAYLHFLSLKVEKGRQAVARELAHDAQNGVALYLENYSDFIQLMVGEEKQLYKQLAKNEHIRINRIKRLEKESPYYLFCQAEIKLQWAVIKLKFGEELGAAWNIRQAYKLLEENDEKFPDFLPNKKSLGLLHVLIGSVPEKYTWVMNTVGMRGSVSQGLQELQAAQQSNLPYRLEATLLFHLIHTYILKSEQQTLLSLAQLCQTYPDNLLLHFFYAMAAMKDGQSDLALRTLQHIPAGQDYIPFYYTAYRIGEVYLQKGNYGEAIANYQYFLGHYGGQNFLKDAYYKLFLAHWLSGKDKEAEHYLNKVLEVGQTVGEADKYAHKFAQTREFPHKYLMQARLSFDGGYYGESIERLKTLSEKTFSHAKDKAEYNYRKARIYHKTSKVKQAIDLYKRTIQLSEEAQYYFGANAALQLGYIYQEQGDKAQARAYYLKALSYKKHEYKNSIDNKAKAALDEL
jgi:tetratricopeptide (TPR) repeat protein